MENLTVSFTIGEMLPIIRNLKIEINNLNNVRNTMMNSYDFNDAMGIGMLIKFNTDLYQKFERRIAAVQDDLVRRGIRDYERHHAISNE